MYDIHTFIYIYVYYIYCRIIDDTWWYGCRVNRSPQWRHLLATCDVTGFPRVDTTTEHWLTSLTSLTSNLREYPVNTQADWVPHCTILGDSKIWEVPAARLPKVPGGWRVEPMNKSSSSLADIITAQIWPSQVPCLDYPSSYNWSLGQAQDPKPN